MLRTKIGVSARDMSLSLGQSPGYINSIENEQMFPSMTVFFYICEYLKITPQQFFATEYDNPVKVQELLKICKRLSDKQINNLIAIAEDLK